MTPILALQEIAEGVASQAALHNQALREFEARTVRVLSNSTIAPPVTPSESDSYIIPVGSPNSWLGAANQIAVFIGGVWSYYTPIEGVTVWINNLDATYSYNGAAWVPSGGGATPLTTKGDVYSYSTVGARVGVGANDTVLTADSAQTTGLKWATPASGVVIWAGGATRVVDALTINTIPPTTVFVDGLSYIFTLSSSNVGSATLKIDSMTVKSITKDDGNLLLAGDLNAGVNMVTYTASPSNFKLHRATPSSFKSFPQVVTGTAGTLPGHLIIKSQLDAKVYGGRITNAGTAAIPYGPSGWTVNRVSAGVVTVTHNLGSVNYSAVATSVSINNARISALAINTFEVTAGADTDFNFSVVSN